MTGASCQRAAERATSKTVPNGAPAAFHRFAALVVRTFRPVVARPGDAAQRGRAVGERGGRLDGVDGWRDIAPARLVT